ncbi:hypothetical protein NRB_02140 [Novosphingobium sp. 11B]
MVRCYLPIPKARPAAQQASVPTPPLIADPGSRTADELISYFAQQLQSREPANDAAIIVAFERRARAYRALNALPENDTLRPTDEQADLNWIVGEQERIILGGVATTPEAIAAKVWVATYMAASAPPDDVDGVALEHALTDGDLDTLTGMADHLDEPMLFALSALTSLKIMEAAR